MKRATLLSVCASANEVLAKNTLPGTKSEFSIDCQFPADYTLCFRKPDPYHAFRKFAGWYLRSERAFMDYCNAFTYGFRYEAKQFGKLTRKK